ncbi:hypothetical protein PFNF135_05606 [Plasmodium falciparum NF135/5.C10]|uniref:Uncharacterized protein n=1 Tax=Plasmodium falciparum NF135/5.C10 TaxID=1036726 RepID=W4I798_PLAFA|nr:hypothetical protein PFNF135_05606 [Plasmodium falciparum NF135/5.C10]
MYFFIWNKSTWEKIVHNKNFVKLKSLFCFLFYKLFLIINNYMCKCILLFNLNIEFLKIYEE